MVQALYSHSLPLGWPWKEVVEGVPCNAASYRVLTWWCLLVSFRIVRKVTGGRRELSQSMFCGTQAISRPEAVHTVVSAAGVFAAFPAVSEQLLLSAANIFFLFLSPPALLSTASLKLPASIRSLLHRGIRHIVLITPQRAHTCVAGHGSVCCCSPSLSRGREELCSSQHSCVAHRSGVRTLVGTGR